MPPNRRTSERGSVSGIERANYSLSAWSLLSLVMTTQIVRQTLKYSRNPWGSQRGDEYNEAIDDLYDRYLPF